MQNNSQNDFLWEKKNEKLLLIFVEIVWESKPQLVKFCLLSQPVLGGCWVLTWLSTQVLITYLDDLVIIQVGYQS